MAYGDILNQAELDAFKAREQQRLRDLAAARGKALEMQPKVQYAEKIVDIGKTLTETLKARGGESAERGLGTTAAAVTRETENVLKPYQALLSEIDSLSVAGTAPAPIYEGGELSGQLAAVIAALSAVGVEGLVPVMADIRKIYPDISSEDALMLLKFDPRFNKPYMTRFAGNKMRMDAGFAPLDDKEYLANEAAYNKIFTAYGLERFANRAEYARQIGNRVAPQELGEKVAATYDRVIKGAAETRKAIQELNPELTDADLMAVALDPATQLPVITRKIQAAEIGGAALAQNLTIGMAAAPEVKSGYTNVTRKGLGVEELLAQGVDLETARRGFANVAETLPTAEKLSAIYGATLDQYGRLEAEQEQFKGLASAKRKREQLTEREIAAFSGEAGAGRGAFAKERTF